MIWSRGLPLSSSTCLLPASKGLPLHVVEKIPLHHGLRATTLIEKVHNLHALTSPNSKFQGIPLVGEARNGDKSAVHANSARGESTANSGRVSPFREEYNADEPTVCPVSFPDAL